MNSRVSWSVEGIDPSVRERAEAAARRAGMSLSDWLNSTIGDLAPPNFRLDPGSTAGAAEPGNPRTSPTFISGWTQSPARSNRSRIRRRATTRPRVASNGRRAAIERRHLAPRRAAVADFKPASGKTSPACRTGSARPTWSSARPPRSIVLPRRSARRRSTSRSRKSLRARTNLITLRRGRCRRAARRRSRPHGATPAGGPDFSVARAPSVQDHQPDRSAAASRRDRAIDRRVPQRTDGDSSRHYRGDAAPGDRIDRERNPLAVPPHRRHPPERHRRTRRWPASNARSAKFAKCCAR